MTYGTILAEGKTKIICEHSDPTLVRIFSKDDLTAGNGAKHDVLPSKGAISNETNANVFGLLKRSGLPVAFEERDSDTSFIAARCRMLPWEVVVRGEAHGSYLKRHPEVAKGHQFGDLVSELYLKTERKLWKGKKLPCDDPLAVISDYGGAQLFLPDRPISEQRWGFISFNSEMLYDVPSDKDLFPQMQEMAKKAFRILYKAWHLLGHTLVDMKVEFGVTSDGRLVMADVIDNDSWRLVKDGQYVDKQVYRDGGDLSDVLRNYRMVAELTRRFPEEIELKD